MSEGSRNSNSKGRDHNDRGALTVIPYVHGLSHRLKKAAARFGVNVVFSAQNKLSSVCSLVRRKFEQQPQGRQECKMRHSRKFVACKKNVVYRIPMTCGHAYIGQTGRCINIRLREHLSSLQGRPFTHLALHCADCGCTPCFNNTDILYNHKKQVPRELVEAFHISSQKDDCISNPSLILLDKEINLLAAHV